MEVSFIVMIGILLLIGIVKKNAIMFALAAAREQGLGPTDAIRQAARQRFRPITMTTFCALIFDRFYRVDPARSSAESTGLDLAVVKSIAELHGATMTVESVVGTGSIFTMHFPRAQGVHSLAAV